MNITKYDSGYRLTTREIGRVKRGRRKGWKRIARKRERKDWRAFADTVERSEGIEIAKRIANMRRVARAFAARLDWEYWAFTFARPLCDCC